MTSAGVEERTTGALSWGVVSLYVMAGGGLLWFSMVMLFYILEQTGKIMTDRWVGWWSDDAYAPLRICSSFCFIRAGSTCWVKHPKNLDPTIRIFFHTCMDECSVLSLNFYSAVVGVAVLRLYRIQRYRSHDGSTTLLRACMQV